MRESIRILIFVQTFWTSLAFTLPVPTSSRRRRGGCQRVQPAPLAAALRSGVDLSEIVGSLDKSYRECASNVAPVSRVRVVETPLRLGLVASEPVRKGDVVLSIPLDDTFTFTAQLAREKTFRDVLAAESFEGWTGDAGLIALLVLNEVARADGRRGTPLPERSDSLQNLIRCWVRALPSPDELRHPLLWTEEAQEVLQASSTNKIYRKLDDIEEDARWLEKNVFEKDRERFPSVVNWNGQELNCFNLQGFTWAVALARSRSVFLDGALRLIPVLDMCNHDDAAEEVRSAKVGVLFGSSKAAQLVASQDCRPGDQVLCSYGPMSASDYLLDYGFCPDRCWTRFAAQLTFEIDPKDRFYDDKMDVLEMEGLNPIQTFDVGARSPGREGEPPPSDLLQFLRLAKLGSTDAFLLESIFRNDVWQFMSLPVSEKNELDVVNAIIAACESALDEMKISGSDGAAGGPDVDVCTRLRESETTALARTVEYLLRDREALDLKEYYQERRLKDLGLDSDWSLEADGLGSDDMGGLGESIRTPGMADFDW